MKRTKPLERRTRLSAQPEKVREFQQRGRRSTSMRRRRSISPASPEQREKVAGRSCIVCGDTPVDPAHILSRSVCPDGADDARAVIGLCRTHHRAYDLGEIGVLEHLEPYHRAELAYAVERFGLISTLEFVTKARWRPIGEEN